MFTYVDAAPLNQSPAGVPLHCRAAVLDAAASLGSFIHDGIPKIENPVQTGDFRRPKAVCLGIEVASAANQVYLTLDGQSTPSATLGFQLPVLPQYLRIPCPDGLYLDNIMLVASADTTYVQCYFEMGS